MTVSSRDGKYSSLSLQARESGADMVFLKHQWAISHFIEAAKSHPQSAVVGNDEDAKALFAETANGPNSKCEPMRDCIASFLREVKYGLSGDR